MSAASEQRAERMRAILERWRADTRAELDAARAELSPEEYEAFHRRTVDEVTVRARELLGSGQRADS
jgi:hypothetical protein